MKESTQKKQSLIFVPKIILEVEQTKLLNLKRLQNLFSNKKICFVALKTLHKVDAISVYRSYDTWVVWFNLAVPPYCLNLIILSLRREMYEKVF